ncbi:MAG: carbon-nitrogen hydrolase family protein [Firmicutes bacterium]|nr:carbon-nitrogen hydrolase family protein [Bacillota bacterium]
MKFALAAKGFINEDPDFNKGVILETLDDYRDRADMVLFGEAFLQGFYGPTFDLGHDLKMALALDHPVFEEIARKARETSIAVSFGFIEREGETIYSSQVTIDSQGKLVDVFRRVSSGWKVKGAGESYREGEGFHSFLLEGRKMAVGLCGDLWFDENIRQIKDLRLDLLLWPVYTDFPFKEWNSSIKYDYAAQANRACSRTLLVNSFCLDKRNEEEIAKGGAALFLQGKIGKDLPAGEEGVLFVEI